MGYSFTFDPPADDAGSGCAFNNHQMGYVRLLLVEAGAIAGGNFISPRPQPWWEPAGPPLPAATYLSNGGAHVTPAQAGFVAARLRRAIAANADRDLLDFLDDAPPAADVRSWVEEFATFNELAATRAGYYVG